MVSFAVLSVVLGFVDQSPTVQNVAVYREVGRFAGWPANHGIWNWGDEILVGFSRGIYLDRGPYHNINKSKAEEFLLARSLDGGVTWRVETPQPAGALIGTAGMRHGVLPDGAPIEKPTDLVEAIDFTHPDFAMTLRMENSNNGRSRFYYSYDRGHNWKGPFWLPLFGQPGVMARTDYIVDGPRSCTVFLTASKQNGREGRPFCARTTDGGLNWSFVGFIGPEPESGYTIMPSSVRLSPTDLLTTVRWLVPDKDGVEGHVKSGIDAYASHDNGKTWTLVSHPEPDTGEGNPPALLLLDNGAVCLVYGSRSTPYGIRARLSRDGGKSWTEANYLRDDAGGRDIGYPRMVRRKDGKFVAIYYYHDTSGPTRYIGATIFNPLDLR